VLRKFSLWLAGFIVLLAVFTLLRGNAGWLTWVMAAWFVIGIAWQVLQSRRQRSVGVNAVRTPAGIKAGNNFDPNFCGRILQAAAIGLIVLLVLELIVFSTVQSAKCPGWQAPTEKQSGSVWVVWLFAAIWTLHIGYRAVTWRRSSRRILDRIERAREIYVPGTNPSWVADPTQFKAMCTVKNNINAIFVLVLIGSGVFVALPVLTRIGCF
jgi:hypothetical protein